MFERCEEIRDQELDEKPTSDPMAPLRRIYAKMHAGEAERSNRFDR